MLVVDGCSVLPSENPEHELKVSTDLLVRVNWDLLLFENQIPYQVLKLLCNDTEKLKRCMRNFLLIHSIEEAEANTSTTFVEGEEPIHLLEEALKPNPKHEEILTPWKIHQRWHNHNQLANDKEVVNLSAGTGTVMPETPTLAHIRDQIESHFVTNSSKTKHLAWLREAYNTYFRSPWSTIALFATTLGLILTWYAIHPKGD
ncbi:hypothetical protein RJT34_33559 [Clitoria ternatea]|uniref:Uncharacterized protein n=1 Tax=Clitoria ternatea TaxID=43366 RepID=A0AAN9EY10_CLITE